MARNPLHFLPKPGSSSRLLFSQSYSTSPPVYNAFREKLDSGPALDDFILGNVSTEVEGKGKGKIVMGTSDM